MSLKLKCLYKNKHYFVKTKRKLDNATKITNGMAIALVLIVLVNIGIFHVEHNFVSMALKIRLFFVQYCNLFDPPPPPVHCYTFYIIFAVDHPSTSFVEIHEISGPVKIISLIS